MVRKEAKGMVNKIEGKLVTNGEKFCIIVGRFNEFIGSKLLSGAMMLFGLPVLLKYP